MLTVFVNLKPLSNTRFTHHNKQVVFLVLRQIVSTFVYQSRVRFSSSQIYSTTEKKSNPFFGCAAVRTSVCIYISVCCVGYTPFTLPSYQFDMFDNNRKCFPGCEKH